MTVETLASRPRISLSKGLRMMIASVAAMAALASLPAHAQSVETVFARHDPKSTTTVDHSAWDRMLKAYVKSAPDGLNRVDYKRFKAEAHDTLKGYIRKLEATDVSVLARSEQFAFWANLYNAKTIEIVLSRYPVRSIKDISLGGGLIATFTGGPWKAKVVKVGGFDLSLDDIEHVILRTLFKDPRVHYAVNCASVGCPNLMAGAFTGAALEQQLEAGERGYVNHPRGIRVEKGRVHASSIFDWFRADFGGNAAGVLQHVRKYAEPTLLKSLEGMTAIHSYDYDWSLNDVRG